METAGDELIETVAAEDGIEIRSMLPIAGPADSTPNYILLDVGGPAAGHVA